MQQGLHRVSGLPWDKDCSTDETVTSTALSAAGKPTSPARKKPPLIGCYTKFLLIAPSILLIVKLEECLETADGRRDFLAKTKTLLSSVDTYIVGGVVLLNVRPTS